ncbi:hypothetical protein [Actinomadura violacea]|uniref:Integral membrane protein n=1 Tax=Actinomadura violacea TaxID=2819934 RepID=A0ABS3S4X6_9ACTN|nr:hypothetical protein [Actinomadura violacea]MBO2463344.1 hypothetical protein [Actinomadura violacea]
MNTSEIAWAGVLACVAQAVYFIAFVLFKTAVGRIGPIGGRRPLHGAALLLRSPRWVAGVAVVLAGFALFAGGLTSLPVVASLPAYGASLALLLVVGMSGFGERPTSREWLAVVIVVAAMLTAALSVLPARGETLAEALHRPDGAAAAQALPLWKAGLVFVPSLGLPLWMFFVRDRQVAGRHARPITGIAYGLGAGVLLGATEVFGQGMAMMLAGHRGAAVLSTPHPYLFVLAGVIGLGLLSIGLQRCRLTIIVTVVTVTAKTHLLLSATLLYGEPWPHAPALFLLRLAGVLLAVLALLAFPRHERRSAPRRARRPEVERPAPARPEPAERPVVERPVAWTAPRAVGRYARTVTRFPDGPSAYPDSPLASPPPAGHPIVRPAQPPDAPARFPAGG